MVDVTRRRGASTFFEDLWPIFLIGALLVFGGLLSGTFWLAATIDGVPVEGLFPVVLLINIAIGDQQVPPSWLMIGVITGVIVLAVIILVMVLAMKRGSRKSRVDHLAGLMGKGREIERLQLPAIKEQIEQFDIPVRKEYPGQWLGNTVLGNRKIYGNWEDVGIDIWGPRTGKTTSRAVPLMYEAPGVVVATSNKRDIVDIPRAYRQQFGRVWVFDPQDISGEANRAKHEGGAWYWDPLTFVTDSNQAKELAGIFSSATREPGAKADAHFDGMGKDLLAGLFLAASKGARPLGQVWTWLQDPKDDTPIRILQQFGEVDTADQLESIYHVQPKQRDGYFSTAVGFCSVMLNQRAMAWVQPRMGAKPFDVDAFVRSEGDTLISLSKEGQGTAGPLVAALTVAVTQAAERYAQTQPRGRMPIPMVVVLDEAANVCKWDRLPDMYSHYGSRGIMVDTILQSWSQGVAVWGEEGMKKLWSAATIKIYGGGVSEMAWLEDLSKMIGDFWTRHSSISTGGASGRSVSNQVAEERIFPPSDLAAMPKGRMVIAGSGIKPVLAKTISYWQRPYGKELPGLKEQAELATQYMN